MATEYGSDKRPTKADGGVWVARGILLLIAIAFFIGLGGDSGDKIDKHWLGDRYNGSLFDVVGVILFFLGIIWIMGIASWLYRVIAESFGGKGKDLYHYGSRGEAWKNVGIGAGLLLIGFLFIWL